MIITDAHILEFRRVPVRGFRWETYKNNVGAKMWQASCQFDIKINLDPALPAADRERIEYRQYIAGEVWIKRGSQQWTNLPNGNKHFPIPAYAGLPISVGVPDAPVRDTGLTWDWKEDGLGLGSHPARYGYRGKSSWGTNELDMWTYPDSQTGTAYRLRDTPSIAGEWGYGDAVELWIDLYFLGYVVEVTRDAPTLPTYPLRVLKWKEWQYSFHGPEAKLTDLNKAIPIPNRKK